MLIKRDELSAEEKVTIKQGIKEGLEGLKGKVPGIVDTRQQRTLIIVLSAERGFDHCWMK